MSAHAEAPHATPEAAVYKNKRAGNLSRRAMELGIGLGVLSYPIAWLGAAVLATGAFIAGSALAIGGMLASVFGRKA